MGQVPHLLQCCHHCRLWLWFIIMNLYRISYIMELCSFIHFFFIIISLMQSKAKILFKLNIFNNRAKEMKRKRSMLEKVSSNRETMKTAEQWKIVNNKWSIQNTRATKKSKFWCFTRWLLTLLSLPQELDIFYWRYCLSMFV